MKATAIESNARLLYFIIFFTTIFIGSFNVKATHIVGATLNYEYVSGNKYKISVLLYRDCRTTVPPIPVAAPNDIKINVRRSDGKTFRIQINKTSKRVLPVPLPDDPCAQPPNVVVCVEEYLYTAEFDLFESGFDHYLFFSLCCRNSTITNLAPEQQTETIYTKIPDRAIDTNQANAQFVNPPPSYVCGGKKVTVPHAATDADGDVLKYSLYTPNAGPQNKIQSDIYIPTVSAGLPNFVPVTYSTVNGANFSGQSPMNAKESIDSTNGDLTFIANNYGQFVVGVKVQEYRNNKLISETLRDYQFNIVRCPPPAKAVLALSDICNSLRVQPSNSGIDYPETGFFWNFGEAAKAPKDTSYSRSPSYTYTKAGTYTIKLIVNPFTKCADSTTKTIRVSQLKAAFTSSRDTCAGFPVDFTDKSTSSVNTPITNRDWNFLDGSTSTQTNPTHIYTKGGNYNVRFVVTNAIGCKDSVTNIVKIIQETPVAVAGSNDTLCKNDPTAQLKGIVNNAGGGIWKGGAGTFNPDNITLNAKYTPHADELKAGFADLKLVTTKNGKCGSDSTKIRLVFTDAPSVTPAIIPYSPVCGNNPSMDLRGRVLPANFGIIWSGSGGTFDSPNNPFAVYTLSPAELAAGKVTLTITSTKNGKCLPATANTTVTINPPPVVSAGNDTSVCINAADVNLRGTVTVPTKVLWSTNQGDGTFIGGNTSLNTIYRPGPGDLAKQPPIIEVFLSTNETPTFTYPQNCKPVKDTMYISLIPASKVSAGGNQTVCSNNPNVSLKGSVTFQNGAGKGTWVGGNGTFNPDRTSLNITYTPTAAEIAAKSLKLYLTSNNPDKCLDVTDSVTITFSPSPVVDAGLPDNFCKNNPAIKLKGVVGQGSSTGVWSGGKGTYAPDSANLNAIYTPTASELAAGKVKFTLKSTNNGKCAPVSNTVTHIFNDLPKIDAGQLLVACKNNSSIKLNASIIQGAKGVKWSGGAGKFTPSDTVLNPVYQPTAAEANSGKIVFTATSIGNGNCNPVTDTVSARFIDSPTASAGTAGPVCANNSKISLSGTSSTGSGVWSSTTGGNFVSSANDLVTFYIPSKADSSIGSVLLTLTSANNGLCQSVKSNVTVTITAATIVVAGPQQVNCANNPNIKLAGSVNGGASTGIWSGGTNNFPSGNTNLTGTYVPSPQEISKGKVLLTLSSTGNSNNTCVAVSDTVTFYFSPAPILNAGGDKSVCGDLTPVDLTATASSQITSVVWSTDGNGTFTNPNNLVTTYKPTIQDQDKNSIKLTLTSIAQGNCKPVNQSLNIIFTTKPVANAGPDFNYCTTDSLLQLSATGSPGTWSATGGGDFTPSASSLNAKYKPSASDISNKAFTLKFSTLVSGPCASVSDNVNIKVLDGLQTTFTAPTSICAGQLIALSSPKVSGVRVKWSSTGSGTFTPGDTAHNATYSPSQTEIKNGNASLSLEVITPQCGNATKNFNVKIAPKYDVTAGGNQQYCADITSVSLSGTKSGNFPVKWSSNGSGSFSPNDTSLVVNYIPSKSDLSTSGFKLTLTSKGTGCPNNASTIDISILTAPLIEAGNDIVICNDTSTVALNGALLNNKATGGFWTTNAGGTFNPNALSASYSPKSGEKGVFKFFITSTGNGICKAVKDSIKVTINDRPTIDALSGTKICADADTIKLSVKATNNTGIQWSKIQASGTIKNDKDTSTIYLVVPADRNAGFASFKVKTVQGADKCKPVEDQVVFDITPPTVVSAGGNVSYCANSAAIPLTANVTAASKVAWKTLGNGTFTDPAAFTTSYRPSKDDAAKGKVDVVVTALATNICKAKNDIVTITLTPEPTVTVPSDFDVCADSSFIKLDGVSSTGSGNWSSNSGNNFSPNAASQSVKFVPTAADIVKGKITFTFSSKNNASCAPVSKNVVVTITPAPKVTAGSDQEVCADISEVNLTGTVTVAGGVSWTSSGSGKFNSTNTSTGSSATDGYILSSLDTLARQVTLTITTTNAGKCKPVSDQIVIKITPAPFIDAGPKTMTQCGDKTSVDLSGSFGNAKNGKWSASGKGKFAPTDSSKVASYLITSEDVSNGKVNIVYTTSGVGKCRVYRDTLSLNITPAPKVSVSGNREVCADKDTVHLSGTKTAAQGVLWSTTGKGIISPKSDSTNIVYKLTQEDKRNGTVKFAMAATGIGTCNKVADSLVVSIGAAPTVDAGKSEEFCASTNSIDLTGSITVANSGVWKTSGSGTFSDSTDLFGKYFPSPSDKLLKSVVLTLTTKDNGLCNPVSSKVSYTFTPIPEVTIGTDQTICKDAGKVTLNGSFKNAKGASWVPVNGKGTFSPDNSQSITSYVFDSSDVTGNSFVLNYVTFGNGVCNPVSKSLTVKFTPTPVVSAGNTTGICSDAPSIILNGTVQNAGGGQWKTSGSGSLVSSGQGLQASYIPTSTDIINEKVKFYLTSKNNNGCKAYTDSIEVPITKAPTIVSIPSHTICADSAGVLISPSLSGNVNSIFWSTASGQGGFVPSNTSQNVTFKPSQTQIANGKATVTLVATGGGVCINSQAKATSTISITQSPALTLTDVSTCQGSTDVELNAVQNNDIATAFKWTSLGGPIAGTFTNENSLSTIYKTSPGEQALLNGEVQILFETTSQGQCKPFRDTITIRLQETPLVDAGLDQTICTNVDSVRLNAKGSVGFWSKIGTGTAGIFKPNAFALSSSYFPSKDDYTNKKVSLVFTSTPGGTCTQKSDTVNITINQGPTFNPGSDKTTCANAGPVNINANNSAGSTVSWITDGTGAFGDSLLSSTTYTPSQSDIAAESISIKVKVLDDAKICKPEYKKFNIIITPAPQVFSGSDFDVCGNAPSVPITGKISKASIGAGKWTVLSSVPGQFKSTGNNVSTLLSEDYVPSAQEKQNTFTTLLFTSNNNGFCKPVSDTLRINFTPSPTVKVNLPIDPVCGDTAYIPLNGKVTVVTGGQWTHNGLGSFTDTNQVSTRYVPNDDERVNGAKVKFTLTSYAIGTCISEKDSFEMQIKPRPTLNPGLETTVCGDTSFILLNGTVSNVGGGVWSVEKGSGKFSSNQATTSNLNDKYIPSATDIVSGQVLLRLSTIGNGNCKPLADFKKITLTPTPKIDAGTDFSVCSNNRLLNLEGSIVRVAKGGKWSSSGSGQFLTTKDSLITSYNPSSQDSSNQKVTFFLISTGNGACKPSRDTLNVKLTMAPVLTVSVPAKICADSNSILLSGNVSGGATSGLWSSTGKGVISEPSALNTIYNLSEADKTVGNVVFIFLSDNNGNCKPVSKQAQLNIDPRPVIFAGNDTTVCSDNKLVQLKGTKNAVITATNWLTSASPTFTTPSSNLTVSYAPVAADVKKGAIVFVLQSTAQGLCKPVKDVKVLNFQEAPVVTVNAGLPKTVCANNSAIELSGKVLNANRSVWASLTTPSVNRGTFEDSMKVNSIFQPSISELGNGKDSSKVTLRLTAYNTVGQCTSGASSDVMITILPIPTIEFNAPADTVTACADKDTVFVSAVAKIAGKIVPGFWASSGTGVFETNAFISNPVYRFSQDDRKRGQIALIFKSDGNIGCDTVSKVKIIKLIPAVPTADAGPDQEICKNNATFNLEGAITTATKSGWHSSSPVSKILPDSNQLQIAVVPLKSNLDAGAIKMKLRTHGPATCKDVTDEMFVNFTEPPVVTIPARAVEICSDSDSLPLSASIKFATGGIWTTTGSGNFLPSTTTVNAIYVASASDKDKGSVKLKLTSTGIRNCNAVSDSIQVNILKAPVVSGSAESICVTPKGIALTGKSSTGSGEWKSSGTGSFSPNAKSDSARYFPGFDDFTKGQIQLSFTTADNKSCKPVSQAVAINVSPVPIADAGKDQKICIGTGTQIAALAKNNIVKYSWTQLPANASVADNMVLSTGNLNANALFKLEVTDNKGCKNSDTVSVTVMQTPVLEYPSPFCAFDLIKPISNKIPKDTIDGAFQWFREDDLLVSQNHSSIVPDQKGNYVNMFSIYNCSVKAATKVNPVPSISGINKYLCQNTPTTVGVNLVENKGYDWTFRAYGKPNINILPDVGNKVDVKVGKDTLVYYVSVKDFNFCVGRDSIIVYPVPAPVPKKLIDTTLCGGANFTLNGTPVNFTTSRISYKWLPKGETTALLPVTAPITVIKSDTSKFILTTTVGECSYKDSASIITNPKPNPEFPDIQEFCTDGDPSLPIPAVVLDAGSNGTYNWSTGETTRKISVTQEGKYKVVVVNEFKCTGSDSVTLIEKCKPTIFKPDAFTPNGDGKNDVFRIFGNKFVKNFKLLIFNRWGEVIYYLEDIPGNSVFETGNKVYAWDGTYRGEEMPMGSYPYIITYEGKIDEFRGPYQLNGSVTLIR